MDNKLRIDTEKIKLLMAERDITVADLVKDKDISETVMQKLIDGYPYKRVPLIYVAVLCAVLKLKFDDLFI